MRSEPTFFKDKDSVICLLEVYVRFFETDSPSVDTSLSSLFSMDRDLVFHQNVHSNLETHYPNQKLPIS